MQGPGPPSSRQWSIFRSCRTRASVLIASGSQRLLLAVEHAFHEWVHHAMHHRDFWLEVTANWLVSAVIGGFVGLVEVALATELMVRNPRRSAQSE